MYTVRDLGLRGNGVHARQIVFDEKFAGRELAVPLLELKGARPGPTMFFVAMQHGHEPTGAAAVHTLLSGLCADDLSGRILAVPAANPLGFVSGAMCYPSAEPAWLMHVHFPEGGPEYPVDHGHNMNRLWPGKPDGNLAARTIHAIFIEAASRLVGTDFAVDVHCHYHWNACLVILQATHAPSVAFGRALGARVSHRSTGNPGMCSGCLSARGVPTVTIELTPHFDVSLPGAQEGARMLRNGLRYAGMLGGAPETPAESYEFGYEAEKPVLAGASGMVLFRPHCLDVVRQGELLAEIIDPRSFEVAQRILAPFDCIVSRAAWNSCVEKGWAVCKVVDLREAHYSDALDRP